MRHFFYDSLKRFLMALSLTVVGIFSATAANLPAGYTELEYIESTGTQYIDTGVARGSSNFVVEYDINMVTANGARFAFSGASWNVSSYLAFDKSDNTFDVGQGTTESVQGALNTRYKLKAEYKVGSIVLSLYDNNETLLASATRTNDSWVSSNTASWLFGTVRDIPSGTSFSYTLKSFGGKIWQGTTLVRDFVPAQTIINGETVNGMYDTVGNQFYRSAASGTNFTAGPAVPGAIQSVTVYGLTEQIGTPSPTTPADIKTNNGVLKWDSVNQTVYTDGRTETIADSANHNATVATLLGVGTYKDSQNINTGAITRNVGIKVLDGTENWEFVSATNPYFRAITDFPYADRTFDETTELCSHFPIAAISASTQNQGIRIGQRNTSLPLYVFFRYNDLIPATQSNVSQLKTWLADQYAAGMPVIIIYPLATATSESVAGQTMTTAPVSNISGGVTGMTIKTILSGGAEIITTIAETIKIATTKYNEDAFANLVTTLNSAITKVTSIVDTTVAQATSIGTLATTKQDRPADGDCPAGRKCLLVTGTDGKPHWYLIQE